MDTPLMFLNNMGKAAVGAKTFAKRARAGRDIDIMPSGAILDGEILNN